jgi:hypothetical protein
MKSKAILFGINYINSPSARLNGCINDLNNMGKFLKEEAKYDVVKIYTDETDTNKVSGNFIINSIYKLAIDSHRYNLERVWIHFSGHGYAINDVDGDEKDGKDECIVPADYHNGVITDDLIKRVFRYFNKKTEVRCVFDCCHSGTIGDLRYSYRGDNNTCYLENMKSKCHANIVLLSGCMDKQTSTDAYNVQGKKEFSGAMTSCLLMSMKDSSNVLDVLMKVRKELKKKNFSQIPVLTTSFQVDSNTKLF